MMANGATSGRRQRRRGVLGLLVGLVLLAACDGLYADIPRIGYELTESFGQPPLVHRVDGNSLEVIFPEELVLGADSASRHDLAWRIAREAHALVGEPGEVPYVKVTFRARQQRRQTTDPREESYRWSMEAVGAGNVAAVDGPRRTPLGSPEMGSGDPASRTGRPGRL